MPSPMGGKKYRTYLASSKPEQCTRPACPAIRALGPERYASDKGSSVGPKASQIPLRDATNKPRFELFGCRRSSQPLQPLRKMLRRQLHGYVEAHEDKAKPHPVLVPYRHQPSMQILNGRVPARVCHQHDDHDDHDTTTTTCSHYDPHNNCRPRKNHQKPAAHHQESTKIRPNCLPPKHWRDSRDSRALRQGFHTQHPSPSTGGFRTKAEFFDSKSREPGQNFLPLQPKWFPRTAGGIPNLLVRVAALARTTFHRTPLPLWRGA